MTIEKSGARPRIVAALGAALAAASLALAACGGSSSDSSSTASGDSAAGGAPYDVTLATFVADLAPEKTKILKAYVADNGSCDAEFKDDRFVLAISGASTNYKPSTPLPKVIEKYC
jgi:hypothetical protein